MAANTDTPKSSCRATEKQSQTTTQQMAHTQIP